MNVRMIKHAIYAVVLLSYSLGASAVSLFGIQLDGDLKAYIDSHEDTQFQAVTGGVRSGNIASDDGIVYYYTIATKNGTNEISSVTFNMTYPDKYGVLDVFQWVNKQFASPESGPNQIMSIPSGNLEEVKAVSAYKMSWGCKQHAKYVQLGETVLYFQDGNDVCLDGYVHRNLAQPEIWQAEFTLR